MKINQTFASVIEFVPKRINQLIEDIQKMVNLSPEGEFQVRLILEESITNGIKHGNDFNTSLKVNVEIEIKDDVLHISVKDEGPGFDVSRIPDPTKTEEQEKMLSFGRGLFLLKRIADDVKFNESGSCIMIAKKLTPEMKRY